MSDDSALRIQIALRAAMAAKATLEVINLEPRFVRLQLTEVLKMVRELNAILPE